MLAPRNRSLPWDPEAVRALLDRCGFSWRQRCVLEALVLLARADGRVFHGNARLARLGTQLGPSVAKAMGIARRRTTARIDLPYLCRTLARLRRLGIIDHFWPRLGPKARWHRVLRVREEALRVYAAWGEARGRRWRSRDGRCPDAPEPRVWSFRMRRLSNQNREGGFAYTDGNWRYMHGPEWEDRPER